MTPAAANPALCVRRCASTAVISTSHMVVTCGMLKALCVVLRATSVRIRVCGTNSSPG